MKTIAEEFAAECLDLQERFAVTRALVREAVESLAAQRLMIEQKDRQITSLRDQVRALLGAPDDDSRQ